MCYLSCKRSAMKSNKELRAAYKATSFKAGVFQIRNTVTGKIFVGSSTNLDAIWNRIKVELKFGGHRNSQLQQDWNSIGEDHFAFEIISELELGEDTKKDLGKEVKKLEEMFIEELQPFGDKGYNPVRK